MINVISTQDELFKDYIFDDEERVIKNLSQINIFIGENNSGKSRFLRGLYSINKFEFELVNQFQKKFIHTVQIFYEEFEKIFSYFPELTKNYEHPIFKKIKLDLFLSVNFETEFKGLLKTILELSSKRFGDEIVKNLVLDSNSRTFENFEELILRTTNEWYPILNDQFKKFDFKLIKIDRSYIPILRGLIPIQISSSDNRQFSKSNPYLRRTIVSYFNLENQKIDEKLILLDLIFMMKLEVNC